MRKYIKIFCFILAVLIINETIQSFLIEANKVKIQASGAPVFSRSGISLKAYKQIKAKSFKQVFSTKKNKPQPTQNPNPTQSPNPTNDPLPSTAIPGIVPTGETVLEQPDVTSHPEEHTTEPIRESTPDSPDKTSTYKLTHVKVKRNYTYKKITELIKKFSKSSVVKTFLIGKSVDKRNIYSIEIGEGKKVKMLTANIHARETANTIFIMKYISKILNRYKRCKKSTKRMLKKYKLVIVPCVNPDGYTAAKFGKRKIRNKKLYICRISDKTLRNSKCNANGVDLNRNFPTYLASAYWGTRRTSAHSSHRSSEFYAGPYLGSEPETRALMAWFLKYIPSACSYVDFHSQGRVVYYGKPHLSPSYNLSAKRIASSISAITHYGLIGEAYQTKGINAGGTLTDFAAELSTGFKYNKTTKRLSFTSKGNRKIGRYSKNKHKVSICTPETMTIANPSGAARAYEWKNKKIYKVITKIVKYKNK